MGGGGVGMSHDTLFFFVIPKSFSKMILRFLLGDEEIII